MLLSHVAAPYLQPQIARNERATPRGRIPIHRAAVPMKPSLARHPQHIAVSKLLHPLHERPRRATTDRHSNSLHNETLPVPYTAQMPGGEHQGLPLPKRRKSSAESPNTRDYTEVPKNLKGDRFTPPCNAMEANQATS